MRLPLYKTELNRDGYGIVCDIFQFYLGSFSGICYKASSEELNLGAARKGIHYSSVSSVWSKLQWMFTVDGSSAFLLCSVLSVMGITA